MRIEIIDNKNVNKRIDIFLGTIYPQITRSASKKIVMSEFVKLNGQKTRPSVKLILGDELLIDENAIREFVKNSKFEIIPQQIDFDIIFEDENTLIIDKPSGIAVHPSYKNEDNTILNGVIYYIIHNSSNPFIKVRPVHRLDKDTSGILIFSKNLEAQQYYSKIFKKREIQKTYHAIVEGNFQEFLKNNKVDFLEIENYISKKPSQLKYSSSESSHGDLAKTLIYFEKFLPEKNLSILKVLPHTGRTHQIRVHLSEAGFPILGDKLYNGKSYERLMLNAQNLKFIVFGDNKTSNFNSKISLDSIIG